MFTGDFPAHDVWLQSRDENRRHGKVATDLVKKYFPETTVINNIGNHEPFPVNRLDCHFDEKYRKLMCGIKIDRNFRLEYRI